jgi:putative peptidoglycan lipid II flippase
VKWPGRNRKKLTDQERRIIEQTPVHEAPRRIPVNHQNNLLHKNKQSMTTATIIMMIGLLLSKLSGQLREILIAPILGYGVVSDAYLIGFQIPDLFYQLLVGGAIQAAITPALASSLENKQESSGWRSVSIFINFAAVVMLIAVIIGEFLAPMLIGAYTQRLDQETTQLAVRVTRALFPQVFFMMMAALCIGVLNAYRKFSSTSFGPSIYNTCVVLAMVILGSNSAQGAVRVAAGVMGAAAVYFVMQLFLARKEFKNYILSFDFKDSGFLRLLRLAVPTLISGSIVQLNTIILTSYADQFAGAPTSLRQASTTWQLPYGVFVIAIGNVMLPSLARLYAARDYTACRRLYQGSLRKALFLTVPSAAIFLMLQIDVVRAIFQWGPSYPEESVLATASVLSWYCLAMVAQTIVFITNQAFYARKMTKIALLNGLITLALNPLFCHLLTRVFGMGISGLSLAYTLTSIISSFVLYFIYKIQLKQAAPKRMWPYMIQLTICAGAMMITLLAMQLLPINPQSKFIQLAWLAIRAGVGFFVFYLSASVLRIPETEQIQAKIDKIKGKFVSI